MSIAVDRLPAANLLSFVQLLGGLDGWADTMADIATIMIAVAMIAIALALIFAAWSSRKIFRKLFGLLDRLHDDAKPILRHVEHVTNDVTFISASVRADVEAFRGTLTSAQANLAQAAQTTEQRINDFNALLGVVQQEAEQIFVDTASTIRGVRVGAHALRHPPEREEYEADSARALGRRDTGTPSR